MPLITIRSTAKADDKDIRELLQACSAKLAALTGKPEAYVMTLYEPAEAMTMAGTDEPACLVEVRSVGKLNGEQTRAMSQAFCGLLQERLGVTPRRVYVNFAEMAGSMWGFNGSTFG
jgi:phenylpyruvate tautomerase PptA (4-oxalocrotonate tautomerase family)